MKVKRYIVENLPEAVQLIRSELGSDAVILNTKEIRIGGFLGMFRKKRVEVTAAIDESAKKPPARKPATPQFAGRPQERTASFAKPDTASEPAALAPVLPANAVRDRYAQTTSTDQARPSSFSAQMNNAFAQSREPRPLAEPTDAQADTLAAAVRVLEERENKQARQVPEPVAVTTPAKTEQVQAVDESTALLHELRSMKDMMTKLTKQQMYRSMPESVMKWSKRLAEQGVEPAYVEQFAETVNERLGESNEDPYACYETAKSVLREWLQPSQSFGLSPSARIVQFVGPTGVGKTTTIAKLAAEQAINYRRQVGFITADTYRIAAVDQLRTYADILNVPLEVVFSPSELTRAYKKLDDRDLVFMDTAGRNYRNELFVSEVNSLLAPGEESETILVLSMTHKYSDMKLVASQFAKYGIDQLLLTKFDETDTFGSVLNLIREFSFHISYITCGQTVPDDIRAYDPEELVRRLLGDFAHE
ncbi:flagellar biosynthesis protein FlhF [Cohnella yongneupensis]|uniref:Flagellar biosynthesis protein FlhF n=1 Tax=Cohnella yongneupensis TaxID=425006 RepID=A0ABW0R9F4_9BACL